MKNLGLAVLLVGFLWGCPGPGPAPSPTPSPTPTPVPTPTPSPTPSPSPATCTVIDDDLLEQTALMDNLLTPTVRDAEAALGDVCGAPPDESLCRMAAYLTGLGFESFVSQRADGSRADAVFVRRPSDGLLEEHHAVYYANGCWLSNTWRGVWAVANE